MADKRRVILIGLDSIADEHVKANTVLNSALKNGRENDMVYLVCASKSLNLPSDPKAVAGVKSKVEQLAYQVAGFVETTYGVPLGKVTFDCLLLPDSSAGPALCDKAKELNADLIVVGSRGLGAVKRAVLGSVSQYCAVNAACSVLIVK